MRPWLFLLVCAGCGTAPRHAGDGAGAGGHDPGGGGGGGSDSGNDGGGRGDGAACMPRCSGKSCGDDGCGATCGVCPADQLCSTAGTCAAVSGAQIQIDVGARGAAIHPEIYGLAFADPTTLTALNVPLNRWGGNGVTLFNWQLDVHNTGSDYFFENIANNGGDTSYGTAGYVSSPDRFVADNNGARAATLMTVPTIGWTPKDRVANHPLTCGFPVSKYGGQQSADPYDQNCGNGLTSAGAKIAPDPTNIAVAAPPTFEASWLAHLIGKFGTAGAGGVHFYQLDNEMMLWDATHRAVHPMPVTYAEVWQTTLAYAPVIRQADATATILGYTSWGVLDLFESGLDTANNNANDQKAHGGVPLGKWYLQQLATYEQTMGPRLVDCLDLHYYPQAGDPLQNTASLWDPTYHDPSWIDGWLGEPVRLFPRLGEWIAAAYPGTSICVSEYNFNLGSETDSVSALVEADVLGLFGKYGIRLAAYWTTPVDSQGNLLPPAQAFKMYRNYDNAGGAFGTTSIGAASTVNGVAAFAAVDDAGAKVTIVLVNKNSAAASASLAIANFTTGPAAQTYRYVAQAGAQLARGADLPMAGGPIALSLPARSMTLLVVPKR
jgi:hypothetical protein